MISEKSTFALFFGNRGFFPGSLISSAREEMSGVLKRMGHKVIMLDEKLTRFGAVETPAEGMKYAEFLSCNRGRFDGIILSLPNFGDENGTIAALRDCGVPILIQAYPDELDKMGPQFRRDAFCGKFSIMNLFCQHGLPFTVISPHTVRPKDERFCGHVDYFDRLCRVVKAMRRMRVGAVGARTTPFKTVRIDESALEEHGITTETFDLSYVFSKIEGVKISDKPFKKKSASLKDYSNWQGVPRSSFEKLVRLAVVFDSMIEENGLDAIAVRCWDEMQRFVGISPCVVLSEINNRGIPAACEVDVGNAVTMFALGKAAGSPVTCLDWNNNYGEDDDKCILFHCGPVPRKMMKTEGRIVDHAILANSLGQGCSFGCNQGRITEGPFTYGSMLTRKGNLEFYLGQGVFTDDPIPDDFFGCAGVARIEGLQEVVRTIGCLGHRHHASVVPGHVMAPVREAFEKYLGFSLVTF